MAIDQTPENFEGRHNSEVPSDRVEHKAGSAVPTVRRGLVGKAAVLVGLLLGSSAVPESGIKPSDHNIEPPTQTPQK